MKPKKLMQGRTIHCTCKGSEVGPREISASQDRSTQDPRSTFCCPAAPYASSCALRWRELWRAGFQIPPLSCDRSRTEFFFTSDWVPREERQRALERWAGRERRVERR